MHVRYWKPIENVLGTKSNNFGSIFFKFHYIKSPLYGEVGHANELCQVIYLQKKSTFGFIKLLIVVESKLKNDASTLPSGKK